MHDPVELRDLERRLRQLIHWRDFLAGELEMTETEIGRQARAYADADGVKVKPTLDQLRRQLSEGVDSG